MKSQPCIFDCNRIAYIGSVDELLLILIWEEGFYHLGLTHCRYLSVILMSGFGAGLLWFNITWSYQFNFHQSYTTFKICFCIIVALPVVFLTTIYFSICQILLDQAYTFYLNKFYNNRYIYYILYMNQKLKFLFVTHNINPTKKIKQLGIDISTSMIVG